MYTNMHYTVIRIKLKVYINIPKISNKYYLCIFTNYNLLVQTAAYRQSFAKVKKYKAEMCLEMDKSTAEVGTIKSLFPNYCRDFSSLLNFLPDGEDKKNFQK